MLISSHTAFGVVFVAAVRAAAGAPVVPDDLARELAGVVDERDRPRDAATLETAPYRMLLERVAVGPDERTLVNLSGMFTYRALGSSPDAHRGSVVFASGIVAQIERTTAPGVGRTDRNEVYAGVLATLRRSGLRLWAFRAVRRKGDAALYVGDHVHLSGYFLKNVPMVDVAGDTHRMPLVVSPWPTYTGKWKLVMAVRAIAGKLLPLRSVPHGDLVRRPVIDFHADGRTSLNGVDTASADALAAVARFAARHPGAAIVARSRDRGATDRGARQLASLDVEASWKELPAAKPPGLTDAR